MKPLRFMAHHCAICGELARVQLIYAATDSHGAMRLLCQSCQPKRVQLGLRLIYVPEVRAKVVAAKAE